jgi:hypothetical protein
MIKHGIVTIVEHRKIRDIDELLSPPKKATALYGAEELLKKLLPKGRAMEENLIEEAAREEGISRATLLRAKKELEIESKRLVKDGKAKWYWRVPIIDRVLMSGTNEYLAPTISNEEYEGAKEPDQSVNPWQEYSKSDKPGSESESN